MEEDPSSNIKHTFYVGTYTSGNSEGIYSYSLKEDGTLSKIKLVAKSENPSFLTFSDDKKYLVSVNENDPGTLESYTIKQDTLIKIKQTQAGGAHPCFVKVKDNYILTANYTGGNIGLLRFEENGQLSDLLDLKQHKGKSTHQRQDAPHAHSAWFIPNTQDEIVTADLGTNSLWFYTLDRDQEKLVYKHQLQMPEEAGPRHLDFHPNGKWMYVLNELKGSVSLVQKQGERYSVVNSFSTLPEDFEGKNTCADIHITKDGKFLYASNRGHNSLAIFSIDPDTGALTGKGFQPVKGSIPRNFALSPNDNFVIVANKDSNNLVSFKRDQTTGLLEFKDEIEAPNPVCILFYE